MASKGKKGRSKKRKKKGGRKGSNKATSEAQEPVAEEVAPAEAEESSVTDAGEPEVFALDDEGPDPEAPSVDGDESVEVFALDEDEGEPEVFSLDEDEDEPEVFSLDEDDEPEAFSPDGEDGAASGDGSDDVVAVLDEEDGLDAATLIAQVTGAVEEGAAEESAEATDEADGIGPDADESDLESEPVDDAAEAQPVDEAAEAESDEEGKLGPTSTPEARDRIVAAALAHAEMQEARYRVRTDTRQVSRWKARIALSLFAVGGFLMIFPPNLVTPQTATALSEAELMRGRRMTLLLQAEQIEAYRARQSVTPPALTDVPVHAPEIRYVRSSNRLYQLVTYTPTGATVLYDSARPDSEFERLRPNWPEDGS